MTFYERKKEISTKKWTFHKRIIHIKKKGKVHILNFLKRDLLKGIHSTKKVIFNAESLVERWSFLYGKMMFQFKKKKEEKTIRWYFLWQRTPCLLCMKNFLFWTFQRWKIRSFLIQKFLKRWYLLGIFELPTIFQDLENAIFDAKKTT